jgi:hypothetical protein
MCKDPPLLVASPQEQQSQKLLSSGVERCKHHIEAGLLALSVIYGSLYYLFSEFQPSPSFCPSEESDCRRPDLMAYKVVSLLSMSSMGLLGVYNWYFTRQMKELGKQSAEARLFGSLDAADAQSVLILCYQVWDFCVSLTIPEFVEPVFLLHHSAAAFLAYYSLQNQIFTYYSVYFGTCDLVGQPFECSTRRSSLTNIV